MSAPPARECFVIVIAAPSGAGKRTVLERVRVLDAGLAWAVSATTRPPRPGELEGRDYYFLSRAVFEEGIAAGRFVEWAEVHGNLYGTLRSEMDRCRDTGKDTLLELDVQGMRQLRRLDYDVVSVFIMPPSMEELARRLRGRGTDSEEVIAVRLANARAEMAACGEFEYVVVNDVVDRAAEDLTAIFRAERLRARRQRLSG